MPVKRAAPRAQGLQREGVRQERQPGVRQDPQATGGGGGSSRDSNRNSRSRAMKDQPGQAPHMKWKMQASVSERDVRRWSIGRKILGATTSVSGCVLGLRMDSVHENMYVSTIEFRKLLAVDFRPQFSLFSPGGHEGQRLQLPQVDWVTSPRHPGQEQDFFLNVRGQHQQIHDLCDAGTGDVAQASQFGIVGDVAIPDQLVEADGQRHEAGNPWQPPHGTIRRRVWP